MSYKLNKTDGTLLVDLIDGQIDNQSTNLILVGRNYEGFGEFINENFIKMLENFANTSAPTNPLDGQLWWDTAEQRLKVYDGTVWKASGGPFVQATAPTMVAGDLWIDNLNNQLYFYDGTDLTLAGPQYSSLQGESGFRIDTIIDEQSRSRPVAKLFVASELVGVFSNLEFTPQYSQRIAQLVTVDNPNGIIKEGFNVVDQTNFKFHGTATSSNALLTADGDVRTVEQFLPSEVDAVAQGTITINNQGGLILGTAPNVAHKILGGNYFIENQVTDSDLTLRTKSSSLDLTVDSIYIDSRNNRVGIFNSNPEAMLHIGGSDSIYANTPKDVIIEGSLTVRGDSTIVDVSTLRVEDKNIELGRGEDSAPLPDAQMDDGGLILLAETSNKSLTWKSATDAWTSTEHFDLVTGKSYKINGADKLSADRLENDIRFAEGLIRIGTLQFLNVDNLNLNGNTITSNGQSLRVDSYGTMLLSNPGFVVSGPGTNEPNYNFFSSPESFKYPTSMGVDIPNPNPATDPGRINQASKAKITGVATPISKNRAIAQNDESIEDKDDTVATKGYVDYEIETQPIVFSLDITGLDDSDICNHLEAMFPSAKKIAGSFAFISTTTAAASTAENIDVDAVKNISFVAVDSNGTQNESVMQDVAFFPASGTVSITISRGLKRYTCVEAGGVNTWDPLTVVNLDPGI